MSETFMIIIRLCLASFAVLVALRGVSAFFPSMERKELCYVVAIPYLAFQVLISMGIIDFSPLLVFLINLSLVFLLTLPQIGSWSMRLIFSACYNVIAMALEVIIYLLLGFTELPDNELIIVGSAISYVCLLILIMFLKRYYGSDILDMSARYWLMLLLIPVGSIYIIYNVFMVASQSQEYNLFASLCALILLGMNIIIFGVYEQLSKHMESQRRNLLYEQQLDLCNQNAAERELQIQEIRTERHNMKDHLVSLHGMAIKWDCTEIATYIETAIPFDGTYHADDVSRTGNVVVDSLVNYKCALAKSEGASIRASVFVPIKFPFQAGLVSIILGNLLENALEACREVDMDKRFIELNVSYKKGMLFITVKNPFSGERRRDKHGRYLTTKKDSKNHGLGLLSVMDAAKRYRGELTIDEHNANEFSATVVLYDE